MTKNMVCISGFGRIGRIVLYNVSDMGADFEFVRE